MKTKFKQLQTRLFTGSHPVADMRAFTGSRFKGEHTKRQMARRKSKGDGGKGKGMLFGPRPVSLRETVGSPSSAMYSS